MTVVGLTKTLYYRETDPKTGKQSWIKLEGVRGTNDMIFIEPMGWKRLPGPGIFVYKRARRN